MQQFIIAADSFNRQQTITKVILRRLIILAGCVVIVLFSSHGVNDMSVLQYLIPFLCMLSIYGMYQDYHKQKRFFDNYKLTVDDDMLVREQFNVPAISIRFEDVKEIIDCGNETFVVKGPNPKANIYIPAKIENGTVLKDVLNNIKPLTIKKANTIWIKALVPFTTIAAMGLLIPVYIFDNKWVVGICGSITLCLMIWGFYVIHTNKNISNKAKRNSWLMIIVFLSIAIMLYLKLLV
jgi:hypothetical protein